MAEKSFKVPKIPATSLAPLVETKIHSGIMHVITITDHIEEYRTNFDEQQSIPRRPVHSVLNNQEGEDVTTMSISPIKISDNSSSSSDDCQTVASDWAIPRWHVLEGKRLALCRQRVDLERRLFEFALERDAPQQFPEPHRIVVGKVSVLWSGSIDATTRLPTGYGRMVFPDGQVYEGRCKSGLRHGQGRNVWSNQQVFTGDWLEGRREGRGTHTWPDGRTVTGSWVKGHLHGRIFFAWPDGATYDGDTVAGQKEGRGTHTWSDGRVYTGEYWAGYEHGVGMITESNQNSKYRGQFRQGMRHGYGVQIWATKTYDGEWFNNMVHGSGKLLWRETGACYTGHFRHGKYHGIGCYSDRGKKYVGCWRNGTKTGEGKQYWPDRRAYEGSFQKNKRHGYGRMAYADGTLYTGDWKHGKRSGQGIEIAVDGSVRHCGLWKHGKPVFSETETGQATADDLSVTHRSSLLVNDEDTLIYSRDRSLEDTNLDASRALDFRLLNLECTTA